MEDYSKLSSEQLIELLKKKDEDIKKKDETIEQAVKEVSFLSIQKDNAGLPVLTFEGKTYQSSVFTATVTNKDGVASLCDVRALAKNPTKAEVKLLVEKGVLIEVKEK